MAKAYTERPGRRPRRVFYGWWIVAVGLIADALKHGTFNRGFTVFFLPIQEQLGISRAALSLAETLGRLQGGIQGPVVGFLTDRYGSRVMMVAGGVISGLGFILLAFTHNYLNFMLVFVGLLSVGFRSGYDSATIPAVNQWFRRKKSLAMSLVSAGSGLGGAAITPLIALLVFGFGWRTAALASGVTIIAVVVPLAFLVRRSPESMGLLPDGDTVPRPPSTGSTGPRGESLAGPGAAGLTGAVPLARRTNPEVDFTAREAMKTRSYWLYVVAVGLRNAVHSGVGFHFVPLMVWVGISQPKAALMLGLLSFGTLLFNPVVGWMGDTWSKQRISAAAMVVGVLAMLMLLITGGQVWQLVIFVLLLAFADSSTPLAWAIMGDFFGRRSYATLLGWQSLPNQLMSMSTPVWMGLIFDRTGSYFWAVVPLALMYALSAAFYWTLSRPKAPAQRGNR